MKKISSFFLRITDSAWSYLFIFVFYIVDLWKMSVPLTGDQKTYVSIALEMRERGEWIIPYLNHAPNFLKPPFQYWATLLSWKIFGLSLFGALLPSVLALLGSALLVNRLSGSKRYIPGIFFAASLGSMTYGTTSQMEIWIVLFYLWAWYEAKQERALRAFVIVGVMAWIKGPLYPALWVLSFILYLFFKKRRQDVLSFRFVGHLAIGIFVGLLWYALAARSEWNTMMNVFFMRENIGKIQTSQGSPLGLWAEFFYTLFPWFFWLILSLCSKDRVKEFASEKIFWISYALIPAVFFTFFPYRVNTYLYLLTPLAAWMVCSRELPVTSFSKGVASITSLFFFALSFLVIRFSLGGWIGWEVGAALIFVLLLWSYAHWKMNPRWIAVTSLLIVSLIRVGAVEIGENDLAGLRSYHNEQPTSPLAYYMDHVDIWHEFGWVSAALGTDIARIEDQGTLRNFIQSGGTVIFQDTQTELAQGLSCSEWPRLRKRLKFPLEKLLKEGLAWDDPSVLRVYLLCRHAAP